MVKKIFFILLIFNLNINAQVILPSTNQLWIRFQLKYDHPKFISINQVENRYDFNTCKSFMQLRTQITTSGKIKLGTGFTYRTFGIEEWRYHQIIQYNIHRFIVEERVFTNGTKYRLRYMILSEIKINEINRLNIGLEYMIQCSDYKHFGTEQIRFMFDYTKILSRDSQIMFGYMASIFQTSIIHSFRLTAEMKFKKKTLEK